MRKSCGPLLIGALLAAATLSSIARADDLKADPVPNLPGADYGLGGAFYLRGSVGLNLLWSRDADFSCGCIVPITQTGYGYSIGAGVGYDTGEGFRVDATLDYLSNNAAGDGVHTLAMRSTLGLFNAYYDFGLSDSGLSAAGGLGGYVGAGVGGAYNHLEVAGPAPTPDGNTISPAAAVMAGVSYDMGAAVADIGYRGIYIPQLTNGDAGTPPFFFNQNIIHEIRGSVRYRLN